MPNVTEQQQINIRTLRYSKKRTYCIYGNKVIDFNDLKVIRTNPAQNGIGTTINSIFRKKTSNVNSIKGFTCIWLNAVTVP